MKKLFLFCLILFSGIAHAAAPAPANEVFIPSVKVVDPNTLLIDWKIGEGAYLYHDRIHFALLDPQKATLGSIQLPEGARKEDAVLGRYQIYRHQLAVPVSLLAHQPGDILVDIQYQGCTDAGFCYPPAKVIMHVNVGKDHGISSATLSTPSSKPIAPVLQATEADGVAQVFAQHSIGFVLLSFFGFGLLLAFTPCVLPMVPVLSGIIVGHDKTLTTGKAFLLSLIYVMSMALTYAVVGMVIATLGSNLQIALQQPWVIVVFAGVFVLLALSMFGYYDLTLPVSLQAKLANISKRQQSGAYLGAAIMGALSTLILSPCVTAPLVGALAYIANSGDQVLGALALFSLGLGMGAPLLLVGTAAGHLLPKAGMWMNSVKAFFGLLLLGTAIYLIDRIIPGQITLILWAALFIITSAYLWRGKTFSRGCGMLAFVYGTLLLVGAGLGNTDPLTPLENLNTQSTKHSTLPELLPAIVVTNLTELKQELNRARQLQKPVFLDFYADWCVECKIMEKTTLARPELQQSLARFQVIKADITANSAASDALRNAFHVVAPPTYVILDSQGTELTESRLVGEAQLADFLTRLEKAH